MGPYNGYKWSYGGPYKQALFHPNYLFRMPSYRGEVIPFISIHNWQGPSTIHQGQLGSLVQMCFAKHPFQQWLMILQCFRQACISHRNQFFSSDSDFKFCFYATWHALEIWVLCLVGDFLLTVPWEIGIFVDFLQAILSKSTSYFLVPFFVSLSMRLAAERTCQYLIS